MRIISGGTSLIGKKGETLYAPIGMILSMFDSLLIKMVT